MYDIKRGAVKVVKRQEKGGLANVASITSFTFEALAHLFVHRRCAIGQRVYIV